MAKLTGKQIADKHERRMSDGLQDMVTGIQNVTEAPAVRAVAKKDKLIKNWNEKMRDGTWEKGMLKVTKEDWQKSMIEKGVPRVLDGVAASKDKTAAFFDEMNDHQDRLKVTIDKMPDLTINDSGQRMLAWMNGMAEFKKS